MTAEKDHLQEEGPPKLGLALSGGGFRASFFHLGVLAQMAREWIWDFLKLLAKKLKNLQPPADH